MAPFLVASSPEVKGRRWSTVPHAMGILGWYNLGRLLSYLATGLLVSLIARSEVGLPLWIQSLARLFTAGLLAYSLLRPSTEKRCWRTSQRSGGALLMGLLQGLSPCPPFLTAVGLTLTSTSVTSGLLLFFFLFVGTAVFTVPLALIEPLRRKRALTIAVRVVGALVALYLIVTAVMLLFGATPPDVAAVG